MIKCNLAVLLAERGLKMADVINDTPLSKTAVRGLYYNESKGIQYETLETLCDYLNVEPKDLIKKINFAYELLEKNVKEDIKTIDYKILFTLDEKTFGYIIRLKLTDIVNTDNNQNKLHGLYFDFIYSNDFKQDIYSQLTLVEKLKLEDTLTSDFIVELNLTEHLLREMHYVCQEFE